MCKQRFQLFGRECSCNTLFSPTDCLSFGENVVVIYFLFISNRLSLFWRERFSLSFGENVVEIFLFLSSLFLSFGRESSCNIFPFSLQQIVSLFVGEVVRIFPFPFSLHLSFGIISFFSPTDCLSFTMIFHKSKLLFLIKLFTSNVARLFFARLITAILVLPTPAFPAFISSHFFSLLERT